MAETTATCIKLSGINKSFGSQHVLKDIDLHIPFGQIYGLLGPSGCGKTTMVKTMVGILEADSGQAYVLDTLMPDLGIMSQIGYMAQSDALYTSLSADENLSFFGSIYGMSRAEMKLRIPEVMEIMSLGADMRKPVYAYSGGMKRRLSLATAILHNPPVLVLDEPTVGIDPLLRQSIWAELNRLCSDGVTILVTTHVMDEAEKCHNLAMMREGRIIARGTAADLQSEVGAGSLEEAFIIYGGRIDES
ncbi:MAG: ABC transporter ATP-binding protein [Syntrophomonas sp.]|nr:ABC transporter ATP-binding protein [Syntrophomonas sp.]